MQSWNSPLSASVVLSLKYWKIILRCWRLSLPYADFPLSNTYFMRKLLLSCVSVFVNLHTVTQCRLKVFFFFKRNGLCFSQLSLFLQGWTVKIFRRCDCCNIFALEGSGSVIFLIWDIIWFMYSKYFMHFAFDFVEECKWKVNPCVL